ncbi:uncharacterized protein [Euwallacea fornicatus]|uniref:uncharacterized protein n=1 Tax=Euwallacea fornicatus TaxID=995702 RepID=UPI00338DDAF0
MITFRLLVLTTLLALTAAFPPNPNRLPRSASPHHFKKHGGSPPLIGILGGGHTGGYGYEGNYGGYEGYPIRGHNTGYGGHPGGYGGQAHALAQSSAIAGGHGEASAISQAQSQSASFGFGPFSAIISQAQAQTSANAGGGRQFY